MNDELITLGIDPALGRTGLAIISSREDVMPETWDVSFTGRRGQRLMKVRAFFSEFFHENPVHCVALEGYSMGSSNHRETAGELGGIIRLSMAEAGIESYYQIPPRTLVKFVCGNARKGTGKEEVIQSIKERWGQDFTGNSDRADAFALAKAGEALWFGKDAVLERACKCVSI